MKVCISAFEIAICIAVALFASGCSKHPRAPLSSSASIIIQPHASVGPLHPGMTVQQVIDEIGEPDKKTDATLDYSNLGFSMIFKDGIVHSIVFVDPTGEEGAIKKAFAGRTKEGIALKSSREDVIKIYGQPDRIDANPKVSGDEVLRYQRLGLVFFIHDGKVEWMAVNF
ncbi:MAG TPA: hypothetical protein VN873_03490 [Candidatus Angelobacter sp.]|nr:hypothetical protein [Candidatus Angelobacter sp.]